MIKAPLGYKWEIRYTTFDNKKGMGLTNDYYQLPIMITHLLEENAKNIIITDQTIYKDETIEVLNE